VISEVYKKQVRVRGDHTAAGASTAGTSSFISTSAVAGVPFSMGAGVGVGTGAASVATGVASGIGDGSVISSVDWSV
jgi:hypothetical protein